MWLMTKHGFYSIVEKSDGIHVRARERADLENLAKVLPDDPIQHTPNNDYWWRIVINRQQLGQVLEFLRQTLDYHNFKGEIALNEGQSHKLGLYHDVWATMLRLRQWVRR